MIKIFFILIIVLLIAAVLIFNKLISLRNRVKEAWSGVLVQLKLRYDLVNNLVQTVKAYARHEQQTLTAVVSARNIAQTAVSPQAKGGAEPKLSGAIKSIFMLSEQYPPLKADKNFLELQNQLVKIEQNIQMARRYYNGSVRDLNNTVSRFPTNIVAKLFNFNEETFFELENQNERLAPKTNF
ncbi:LemA family protein [Elusimicrobium minutum Pei191]|uniref:LemA family protein n=1 Tax=Elusimicrobium minutum (strain Pei191) TaxID=445932 RepID=B2KBP2_ELUMP|nr:LemA family protein [Elusimicrobium minutum]ACC97729.1 LemA family protein [Elusimicrobium minutum Pei191]